jgi:alginate O-acetyltransferase complex protein AlgI
MGFDSPVFLFLFLPASLALYHAIPEKGRGTLLLGLSLFFYAWGDTYSLWVLLCSILVNYVFGLIIERTEPGKSRKIQLALVVTLNVALLSYYKYLKFLILNLSALGIGPGNDIDFTGWHLPLGISFFTFAAIAYQVDIYTENSRAEKNLLAFGLYVSHFAKIVAGPIVRYRDAAGTFRARPLTLQGFSEGVVRFVVGLGKKALVANPAATFANEAFTRADSLDMPTAWLGLLAYTIQIYFDFSGYSDMAIGIGRMLGFRFVENFDYPYISQSIQEFWRRWHMSLSTWFRDYLYIPLGGNRVSKARTYCNLVVVFLLCGLWHGASWNFIVWGGYHGLFLAAERAGIDRVLKGMWRPLRHFYAVLVIMVGWVFFRAEDLTQALHYLRALFSFSIGLYDYFAMAFLNRQVWAVIAAGVIGSMPIPALFRQMRARIETSGDGLLLSFYDLNCSIVAVAFVLLVLIASSMALAINTYAPFIYARF